MYDDDADVYRQSDWAQEMVATQGWEALARWVTEQVEIDRQALERGVGSWDDYQRTVGRLDGFRRVLGRPDELVERAQEAARGDRQ